MVGNLMTVCLHEQYGTNDDVVNIAEICKSFIVVVVLRKFMPLYRMPEMLLSEPTLASTHHYSSQSECHL